MSFERLLSKLSSKICGGGAVANRTSAMQKCRFSVRPMGWGVYALPWDLLVTLLFVMEFCATAASAQCRTSCGTQNVAYPFGLEPGCGNKAFENLLSCNPNPIGSLQLQINVTSSSKSEMCNVLITYDTFTITISVRDAPGKPHVNCGELDKLTEAAGLSWAPIGEESCQSTFSQYKTSNCPPCEPEAPVCGYSTMIPYPATCQCKSGSFCQSPAVGPAPPSPATLPSAAPAAPAGASKNETKVVAVVVGAGGALLVTCMCFLCFRKYKSWNSGRVKGREMRRIAHILSAGSSSSSGVTMFTYKELANATNKFAAEKQLGGGGFNTVYKGRLRDGRQVAVKKLNQANSQGIQQVLAEVTVLSKARHRNLVQLYGCCLENKDPLLVYEFVENGTLAELLHGQRTPLDCITRLTIAREVAEALAYLHSLQPPIFHRDVKSTNILVDGNFSAKVGDFGLSRLSDPYRTHVSTAPQGTPGYLDPDYHQTYHLSDKSDVYSLGVVLMELITGKMAVDMSRERGEINLSAMAYTRIQNGTLDELLDPRLDLNRGNVKEVVMALGELGFQCLAPEKDDRPFMREVVTKLRSIQYLALAIPSPVASPLHPQTMETSALIKQNSTLSADWPLTESFPDYSHQLVGR